MVRFKNHKGVGPKQRLQFALNGIERHTSQSENVDSFALFQIVGSKLGADMCDTLFVISNL